MLSKLSPRLACAMAAVLIFGGPAKSQLTSKDRILQPVNPSQTVVLKGTEHPLARPQFDQGRVSSGQQINGTLVFRLSPAQQSDLDRLLRDQQNPASRSYHRWLTPEQYADRFGMSQNDLTKVSAWLKSQEMNVSGASRGRTEIHFSGSAAQVENAFRTQLHRYVIKIGRES